VRNLTEGAVSVSALGSAYWTDGFKSVRGSLSIPASTWTFSICAAMSAKIIPWDRT